MDVENAVDILNEEFVSRLGYFQRKLEAAAERVGLKNHTWKLKQGNAGFNVFKDGKKFGVLPMNYFQGVNKGIKRNNSLLDAFVTKKDK